MMIKFNKKGFSLVELLVVITIIAILSVVSYSAIGGHTIKARDSKRLQDIGIIQQALELYYATNSKYPSAPLTSGTNISLGQIPKQILSDIPVDPGTGNHKYQYVLSGNTYQIAATLEKDGVLANYEAYVVGNSDVGILGTTGGLGRYLNGAVLAPCNDGRNISSGKIGTTDANDKCVPYDPLN